MAARFSMTAEQKVQAMRMIDAMDKSVDNVIDMTSTDLANHFVEELGLAKRPSDKLIDTLTTAVGVKCKPSVSGHKKPMQQVWVAVHAQEARITELERQVKVLQSLTRAKL